ncbi:four-helix bundle copper-binding protein [Nemorincola caseinilytica]|uniref:Four-helix bundle copper-binding protein n=1 Tax=Nemorincola caseinilytica TaxID=2054315 RepID=A0ABP8N7L3_9BACT
MSYREYRNCIDACLECVDVCNHCASSCLKEQNVGHMTRCIQLDLECAAICYATAQLMSLGSQYARQLCSLCATICRECADECRMHHNDHCRECAEICMECADECTRMLEQ